MILKENQTKIKSLGAQDKKELSVRNEDFQHVVELLSTRLYSKPIESLVREIVSNGVDSTIAAGNKKPVFVQITEEGDNAIFKVRDYGTGLSKEEYEELYINFGASSKRTSNDFLGAYGIGRLSPLSYTDSFTVTSFYKGLKYEFALIKENRKVNFYMINEEKTEEEDGLLVEVLIENKEDYILFIKSITKQLLFFDNVVVKDDIIKWREFLCDQLSYYKTSVDLVKYDSAFKLTQYEGKTFKIIEYQTKELKRNFYNETDNIMFLIGNVAYPIRDSLAKMCSDNLFRTHTKDVMSLYSKIGIKLNIGDVEVTPNKEEIIYTKETTAFLEEKIRNFIEELKEKAKEQFDKPVEVKEIFDNYYNVVHVSIGNTVIELKNVDDLNAYIYLDEDAIIKTSIKTMQKLKDTAIIELRKVDKQCYRPTVSGIQTRDLIECSDMSYIVSSKRKNSYYVGLLKDVSPLMKSFIVRNLQKETILKPKTLKELNKALKKVLKRMYFYAQENKIEVTKEQKKKFIKAFYSHIYDKKKFFVLKDIDIPQKFKKLYEEEKLRKKKEKTKNKKSNNNDKYCLKDIRLSKRYGTLLTYQNEWYKLEALKTLNDKIVFFYEEDAQIDSINKIVYSLYKVMNSFLKKRKIHFYAVSLTTYKKLDKLNLENLYSFTDLLIQKDDFCQEFRNTLSLISYKDEIINITQSELLAHTNFSKIIDKFVMDLLEKTVFKDYVIIHNKSHSRLQALWSILMPFIKSIVRIEIPSFDSNIAGEKDFKTKEIEEFMEKHKNLRIFTQDFSNSKIPSIEKRMIIKFLGVLYENYDLNHLIELKNEQIKNNNTGE